jgi:3-deoxy-D-manno-octulosonic-acid transferase
MLEAASFGLPIVTGPHLFNFAEAARLLQEAQAMVIVSSADALAQAVVDFLQDADKRHEWGDRGKQVIYENRGALERHLKQIELLMLQQSPTNVLLN